VQTWATLQEEGESRKEKLRKSATADNEAMTDVTEGSMKKRFLLGLCVLFLATEGVTAHDLWVVPGKFRLQSGEKIRIFLNSGDEFPKSDSLLGEFRISSLMLFSTSEQSPLSRFFADGKSLTTEMKAPLQGTVVLSLATKPRLVRLKSDEFNEYVKEEGLLRIFNEREEHGELDDTVVERYTKWAKAILFVEEGDEAWQKPTGMTIEIMPEDDLYEYSAGQELSFQVLFDGKPLPGATLVAQRAGGPRKELEDVTDNEGRARFIFAESGRWYVRTIHMIRLVDDPETQWESFWATLTFEVQE
jgi:uncharacterized GH25 family protein